MAVHVDMPSLRPGARALDHVPAAHWRADEPVGEIGTFPEWDRWLLDPPLVTDLVTLAELFVDTSDDEAISGKDSLLDHEGRHQAPWGELTGDAHDPTGVRRALAFLRHGRPRRSEARAVARLAERATIVTAVVTERLLDASEWHGEEDSGLWLPATSDVGPVIGWGDESLWARYEREMEEGRLPHRDEVPLEARHLRYRASADFLDAYTGYRTADTGGELERGRSDIVGASKRWMGAIEPAQRAVALTAAINRLRRDPGRS